MKQSFKVQNDFEVPCYDTVQSSEEKETIAEKEPKRFNLMNLTTIYSLKRLLLQTVLLTIVE